MGAIEILQNSKRLIIKIGSALVTDIENGTVKKVWLESLAQDIKALKGKEIIIVSSGAIALGRTSLGIDLKVAAKDMRLEHKQAAASIGQIALMNAFQDCFQAKGLKISQILLNPNDTEHRRTHLNARATLETLLSNGFIPVINENDTTATDEIRFGDNDKLASRVAQMIEADVLVILSTTDGLYTDNPFLNKEAKHISSIKTITADVLEVAGEALSGVSTGGMKSKIESAQIAVNAGTHVIITSGKDINPITRTLNGTQLSTIFMAQESPHNARKRWIAAHLKPKGDLIVDAGAVKALQQGKSLLPVGVKKIQGQFERGDAVRVLSEDGELLAFGLCGYDDKDAQKIIGKHSEEMEALLGYNGRDVIIHRNDLVLKSEASV